MFDQLFIILLLICAFISFENMALLVSSLEIFCRQKGGTCVGYNEACCGDNGYYINVTDDNPCSPYLCCVCYNTKKCWEKLGQCMHIVNCDGDKYDAWYGDYCPEDKNHEVICCVPKNQTTPCHDSGGICMEKETCSLNTNMIVANFCPTYSGNDIGCCVPKKPSPTNVIIDKDQTLLWKIISFIMGLSLFGLIFGIFIYAKKEYICQLIRMETNFNGNPNNVRGVNIVSISNPVAAATAAVDFCCCFPKPAATNDIPNENDALLAA